MSTPGLTQDTREFLRHPASAPWDEDRLVRILCDVLAYLQTWALYRQPDWVARAKREAPTQLAQFWRLWDAFNAAWRHHEMERVGQYLSRWVRVAVEMAQRAERVSGGNGK